MNPKQFLQFGGAILVVLGVVGLLPVFTKANTPWFYLDTGENVAHIGLGIVAIAAAYLLTDQAMQKWLVAVVGVVALFFGVYGFVVMGAPGAQHLRHLEPREPGGQPPASRRWCLGALRSVHGPREHARGRVGSTK